MQVFDDGVNNATIIAVIPWRDDKLSSPSLLFLSQLPSARIKRNENNNNILFIAARDRVFVQSI